VPVFTVNGCVIFQIRGFPTIKMFPSGKKDGAEDYEGGRTSSDIVSFALDKLAENVDPPEVVQVHTHFVQIL